MAVISEYLFVGMRPSGGEAITLGSSNDLGSGGNWSGNVAVSSSTGTFSLSDSDVFANAGIRATSPSAAAGVSNSRWFASGSSTGVAMGTTSNPARGYVTGYDHTPLLADLRSWRSYVRGLAQDQMFSTSVTSNRTTTYSDAADVNGDGFIVVDMPGSGGKVEVVGANWVINGSGNKLIIFRLRNGSNMEVSNATIAIGAGLASGGSNYNQMGVLFVHAHPDEEFTSTSGSSDTVFTLSNVVLTGVGMWDLNTIGDASADTDYGGQVNRGTQSNYTAMTHSNTSGCAQFVSGVVQTSNSLLVRCVPNISTSFDYGDLPDDSSAAGSPTSPGYNTDATGTPGPSHGILSGLRIGTIQDVDALAAPNGTALGDDATGVPDDEDGVTLPTFLAGNTATVSVSVTNTTAAATTLCGYIDFNGDGDFSDTEESQLSAVAAGTTAGTPRTLTFNVPTGASTSTDLGARFRLGTLTCSPDGNGGFGEVEDYLIRIGRFDLALATVSSVSSIPGNGSSIIWTVRVQNQGTVDAANYTVTNRLPTGVTFTSASDGGSAAAGIVTWNIGSSLPPGSYQDLTVNGTVTDVSQAPFRSWAEISAASAIDADSTPDINTGSNSTLPNDTSSPGGGYVSISSLVTIATNATPAGDEDDNDDALVGYAPPAQYSLGNRVWIDDGSGVGGVADDGRINGSEAGIDGVSVALYPASAGGQPTGSMITVAQVTSGGGYYRFDGLPSGDYIAVVRSVNFNVGGPLTGHISSGGSYPSTGPGDADGRDRGVDTALGSGTVDPGGIATATMTVGPGQQPIGETDIASPNPAGESADAESNRTIDFGFVQPSDLRLTASITSVSSFNPGETVVVEFAVGNSGPGAARAGSTITVLLPAGLTFASSAGSGTNFVCAAPVGATQTCTNIVAMASGGAAALSVSVIIDATVAPLTTLKFVAHVSPANNDVPESVVLTVPTLATDTAFSASNNDSQVALITAAAAVGTTTTTTSTTVFGPPT